MAGVFAIRRARWRRCQGADYDADCLVATVEKPWFILDLRTCGFNGAAPFPRVPHDELASQSQAIIFARDYV